MIDGSGDRPTSRRCSAGRSTTLHYHASMIYSSQRHWRWWCCFVFYIYIYIYLGAKDDRRQRQYIYINIGFNGNGTRKNDQCFLLFSVQLKRIRISLSKCQAPLFLGHVVSTLKITSSIMKKKKNNLVGNDTLLLLLLLLLERVMTLGWCLIDNVLKNEWFVCWCSQTQRWHLDKIVTTFL